MVGKARREFSGGEGGGLAEGSQRLLSSGRDGVGAGTQLSQTSLAALTGKAPGPAGICEKIHAVPGAVQAGARTPPVTLVLLFCSPSLTGRQGCALIPRPLLGDRASIAKVLRCMMVHTEMWAPARENRATRSMSRHDDHPAESPGEVSPEHHVEVQRNKYRAWVAKQPATATNEECMHSD